MRITADKEWNPQCKLDTLCKEIKKINMNTGVLKTKTTILTKENKALISVEENL